MLGTSHIINLQIVSERIKRLTLTYLFDIKLSQILKSVLEFCVNYV